MVKDNINFESVKTKTESEKYFELGKEFNKLEEIEKKIFKEKKILFENIKQILRTFQYTDLNKNEKILELNKVIELYYELGKELEYKHKELNKLMCTELIDLYSYTRRYEESYAMMCICIEENFLYKWNLNVETLLHIEYKGRMVDLINGKIKEGVYHKEYYQELKQEIIELVGDIW